MNKSIKRRYQRCGRLGLLIFVFSFFILLGGCGFAKQSGDMLLSAGDKESVSYNTDSDGTDGKTEPEEALVATEQKPQALAVYVCGAVVKPGVYELTEGARVVDALLLAGGYRSDAASEYLNQAEYVEDGQRLYVPTEEEAHQLEDGTDRLEDRTSQRDGTDASGKLDINKASQEELMTLPGIGQAKAQAIIEYRNEHGQFTSIEELKNINGIKDGVYNKVKDNITVG